MFILLFFVLVQSPENIIFFFFNRLVILMENIERERFQLNHRAISNKNKTKRIHFHQNQQNQSTLPSKNIKNNIKYIHIFARLNIPPYLFIVIIYTRIEHFQFFTEFLDFFLYYIDVSPKFGVKYLYLPLLLYTETLNMD